LLDGLDRLDGSKEGSSRLERLAAEPTRQLQHGHSGRSRLSRHFDFDFFDFLEVSEALEMCRLQTRRAARFAWNFQLFSFEKKIMGNQNVAPKPPVEKYELFRVRTAGIPWSALEKRAKEENIAIFVLDGKYAHMTDAQLDLGGKHAEYVKMLMKEGADAYSWMPVG